MLICLEKTAQLNFYKVEELLNLNLRIIKNGPNKNEFSKQEIIVVNPMFLLLLLCF